VSRAITEILQQPALGVHGNRGFSGAQHYEVFVALAEQAGAKRR
jgi:hypothetical protein